MTDQETIDIWKDEMLAELVKEKWPAIARKAWDDLVLVGRGVYVIDDRAKSWRGYLALELISDQMAEFLETAGVDLAELRSAALDYDPLTSVVVAWIPPREFMEGYFTRMPELSRPASEDATDLFASPIVQTYSMEPEPASFSVRGRIAEWGNALSGFVKH